MERVAVSIITPLYKGEKYLPGLYDMIKKCAEKAIDQSKIEWVISSDDPERNIEINKESNLVDIVVINTDKNRGIQGARVQGLENASGEYVLFLDQDDWISPDWVVSQLEHIGDADAVVCDYRRNNRKHYGTTFFPSLEECIKYDFNLYSRCGFIPGQVLIKRSSIPKLWIDEHLKWNCCDDYYLWLCMFSSGCRFVKNDDVLYDHTMSGSNQGQNSYVWYKSTMEMLDVIKNRHLFSDDDTKCLEQARMKEMEYLLQDRAWQTSKLYIYTDLLSIYEKGLALKDGYSELVDSKVAIYGLTMGVHIYSILKKEGVSVTCFIDRSGDVLDLDIPVCMPAQIPEEVDIVINTLIKDANVVNEYLLNHYNGIKIIGVRELLDKALRD